MTFVLVHSPLVGPLTWSPLAQELQRRGQDAVVPEVTDHPSGNAPFWQQHARSVSRALRSVASEPLLLVAHSGAGPLLPAIRETAGRPVDGYVFVDAGIPRAGLSRLDLLREEAPPLAAELEELLKDGGRWPRWSDEDLAQEIPTPGLRRGILQELRPRPEAFWRESIPVFEGWPDAPCGYLALSAAYAGALARARELGWATREMAEGHFHMLVDPRGVADALLDLTRELAEQGSASG